MSWLSGWDASGAQFRSLVPQAREVPAHAKTTASPPPDLADPLKVRPPAHLIGDPEQFIQTPPLPKETEKKTGNGARRADEEGSSGSGAPLPGPDPRGAPGPTGGHPAPAFKRPAGPARRLKGRRLEGASGRRSPSGRLRGSGPGPRYPCRLGPHSRCRRPQASCARPPRSCPLAPRGRPRPTAPTRRKWRVLGAAPRRGRRAAALERIVRKIRRAGGWGRRPGPDAPLAPPPSARPTPAALRRSTRASGHVGVKELYHLGKGLGFLFHS